MVIASVHYVLMYLGSLYFGLMYCSLRTHMCLLFARAMILRLLLMSLIYVYVLLEPPF